MLQTYRERFIRIYGPQEIPFLEMINPDAGLGFPDLPVDLESYKLSRSGSQRQRLLDSIMRDAISQRHLEHVLDPSTIDRLSEPDDLDQGNPNNWRYPDSIDTSVSILAKSPEDIDLGNYYLAECESRIGAGTAIGRFSDLLAPASFDARREVMNREQELNPNKLLADISAFPWKYSAAHFCNVPPVRPFQITLDSWVEPCQRKIDLWDLVVGVRKGRFFLKSLSKGAEVVVGLGHQVSATYLKAVARTLWLIANDAVMPLTQFDWGTASESAFLPRVRHARFILSPASWNVHLSKAEKDSFASRETFRKWLCEWRQQWMAPRYVHAFDSKNRMLIDLDDPWQADELRHAAIAGPSAVLKLYEAYCALDQTWVQGPGGHFTSQVVVPFVLSR
jgi:hypothetical protein